MTGTGGAATVGGSGGTGNIGVGGGPGCDTGFECVPGTVGDSYVTFGGSCDAGTAVELVECGLCSCTAANGTCKIDNGGKLDDENTCTGGGTAADGSGCQDVLTFNPADIYFQGTVSIDQPGTCTPGAEPPAENGCQVTTVDACGMSGVCVPEGPTKCVVVQDNNNCPVDHPGYPNARTLHEGPACNCDCAVESDGCAPQVTLYSDDACTVGAVQVAANNACNLTNANLVESVQAPVASTTVCAQPTHDPLVEQKLCCQ
jgi:hypothetical protein